MLLVILAWMAILPARPALAQEPPPRPAAQPRELIYCAELMSHEEREAYRARMRAARSPEEKAAVRNAHRQEMQERVRQRGGDTPCEPWRRRWRGGRGQ